MSQGPAVSATVSDRRDHADRKQGARGRDPKVTMAAKWPESGLRRA